MDFTFDSMFPLLLVVFLLGLKHGMDPDHLLVIDGISRANSDLRPRLARWTGLLFSLGHGLVVVAVSVAVALFAAQWQVPHWLEYSGALISICFLFALGTVNLHAALQRSPHEGGLIRGIKGRWVGHFIRGEHPALIVSIGALFALSFDTLAHAAIFGTAASNLMQWQGALFVGASFTLGMMTTDTLNSLWLSHLLKRANQHVPAVSRILCLVIAGISMGVGGLGLMRLFPSALQDVLEQWWTYSGVLVTLLILFSYCMAKRGAASLNKG